jgi:hypothetical protein
VVEFLIIFAILAAVVVVVSGPVRAVARARPSQRADSTAGHNGHPGRDRDRRAGDRGLESSSEIAELQAARDAKYREIRDAELDHRTGKLSDADYEAVDQGLRAEAVEILRALDRAAERQRRSLP